MSLKEDISTAEHYLDKAKDVVTSNKDISSLNFKTAELLEKSVIYYRNVLRRAFNMREDLKNNPEDKLLNFKATVQAKYLVDLINIHSDNPKDKEDAGFYLYCICNEESVYQKISDLESLICIAFDSWEGLKKREESSKDVIGREIKMLKNQISKIERYEYFLRSLKYANSVFPSPCFVFQQHFNDMIMDLQNIAFDSNEDIEIMDFVKKEKKFYYAKQGSLNLGGV